MPSREITPLELQELLTGNSVSLIDVREPWEAEICAISGGMLVPLRSLPQRLQDLPAERPAVLYCHHGMRSLMAAQFLAGNGFDALSLAGGIDRWAVEMEPGMARY
jgi:adenylyltransferase/sulfurtransferase